MSLTQHAAALGFPVLTDAGIAVDPAAVRLLPADAAGIGVAVGGGVLEVVVDHIPTAAELSAYERVTGCEVTVTVADPTQFAILRTRASRTEDHTSLADLLTGISEDVHALHLHVGQPPLASTASTVQPLPTPPLSAEDLEAAREFLLADRDEATLTWAGRQWKVAASRSNANLSLTLSRTRTATRKLGQLGLPADVTRIAGLPDGLVLVSSARGNGRTQTVLALAERIAAARPVTVLVAGAESAPVAHHTGSLIRVALGTDADDVVDVVDLAVRSRAHVVAIDAESYSHHDVVHALNLALSGVLVILAVPGADTIKALAALTAGVPDFARAGVFTQLGAAFRVALTQRLLPGRNGTTVPAAALWWSTPGLTSALSAGDLARTASAALTGPGRSTNSDLAATIRSLAAAGKITSETAATYTGEIPAAAATEVDVPAGWDQENPDVEVPAVPAPTQAPRRAKPAAEAPAATASPAPAAGRRRKQDPAAPAAAAHVAPDLAALLDQRIDT